MNMHAVPVDEPGRFTVIAGPMGCAMNAPLPRRYLAPRGKKDPARSVVAHQTDSWAPGIRDDRQWWKSDELRLDVADGAVGWVRFSSARPVAR